MAKWTGQKVEKSELNSGNEYTIDDDVAVEELNSVINNSLYASNIAENVANQLAGLGANDKVEFKGSNPNLLINGDFRVNQRGWTSGTLLNNKYCVDRWYSVNNLKLVTVNYNSITIKHGYQLRAFAQKIEDVTPLLGKTLTLSCKVSNVQDAKGNSFYLRAVRTYDISNALTYSSSTQITGDGFFKHTFTVEEDTLALACQIFAGTNADTEASLDIEYMKLEIGSVATPFSPRPYAEELAMCQRFVRKINSTAVSTKLIGLCLSNGSIGFCPLNLDIPLRTAPTLTYNGVSIYNGVSGGNIDITNMTVGLVAIPVNNLTLQINFAGEVSKVYALRLNKGEDCYILLDAEIY